MRFLFLVTVSFLGGVTTSKAIPLTDLVIYGRVHDPITGTLVNTELPGSITVKINGNLDPSDPTFATTDALVELYGSGTAHYVLKIPRASAGTDRGADDRFLLPGDSLHILMDLDGNGTAEPNEQVLETVLGQVLATDSQRDVRYLDLNSPFLDSDDDSLPDNWERFYFGDLAEGPNDDANRDGVSNLLALASGLPPTQSVSHLAPFVRLEDKGSLVFFFRQSVALTNLEYIIESSDSLEDGWTPIESAEPKDLGAWMGSRLLRVEIPEGIDRNERFFRLKVVPSQE